MRPKLTIQYSPSEPEHINTIIVAIHGLGANSITTWLKDVEEADGTHRTINWLADEDMLPSLTPNAQIWTFEYESDWLGQGAVPQKLSIISKQLIRCIQFEELIPKGGDVTFIFIAHSFGGIVLADMINDLSTEGDDCHIISATIGFVFLGTPFRGTAYTRYAKVIADAASATGFKASQTLLDVLLPDSDALIRLVAQFADRASAEGIFTVCFYETAVTRMIRTTWLPSFWGRISEIVVVPEPLACLDCCPRDALYTSHTGMNKFSGSQDLNYKILSKQIFNIYSKASEIQDGKRHQAPSKLPVFAVLYPQNPHFTGRDNVLSNIRKLVNESIDSVSKGWIALHGLAGIGKSQSAVEFAYRYRNENPQHSVFWVHAANQARFLESYMQVAAAVNLKLPKTSTDQAMREICDWLKSIQSGHWLMIVDNADALDIFARKRDPESQLNHIRNDFSIYVPFCSHGTVLFTSRDRRVCHRLAGIDATIEVPAMDDEECENLLLTLTKSTEPASETSKLFTLLEGSPLAIVHAGMFMQQNCLSISSYQTIYHNEEDQTNLLSEEIMTWTSQFDKEYLPKSIVGTFQVSFNKIKEESSLAAEILSIMGVLDKEDISRECLPLSGHTAIAIEKAIGLLQAFSLIKQVKSEHTYSIHRLVQISVLAWLKISQKLDVTSSTALALLCDAFPNATFESYENWIVCAGYLPHAQAVLKFESSFLPDSNLLHCEILIRMGQYLRDGTSQLKESEQTLRQALNISEVLDPESCILMGSAAENLALTLVQQGRYVEAEPLYEQAIECRSALLQENEQDLLIAQRNLANLYITVNRITEAKKILLEVVSDSQRLLGHQNLDTMKAVDCLAICIFKLGDVDDAEALQNQALDTFRHKLGEHHPTTVATKINLAISLERKYAFDEAQALRLSVLESTVLVYGKQHSKYIQTLGSVACFYLQNEKFQEADKIKERIIQASEEMSGQCDFDAVETILVVAGIYRENRLFEQAEELINIVIRLTDFNSDEESPARMKASEKLAVFYVDCDRPKEAETLLQKVLKYNVWYFGEHYPGTLLTQVELLRCYHAQNQYERFEKFALELIPKLRAALGETHTMTLHTVILLALSYRVQGRLEESEELYLQSMNVARNFVGPDSRIYFRAMYEYSILLRNQARLQEAVAINLNAIELSSMTNGTRHVETLKAMDSLAITYEEMGNLQDAALIKRKALTYRRKVLGDSHAEVLRCMSGMIALFEKMEDLAAALPLQIDLLGIQKAVKGEQHEDTLQEMEFMVRTLLKLGELDACVDLREEIYNITVDKYGHLHETTLTKILPLVATYIAASDGENAILWLKKLLAARTLASGPESHQALAAMDDLGSCYIQFGQFADAEAIQSSIITIRQREIGPEHPDTLKAKGMLAMAIDGAERYEEAETLMRQVLETRLRLLGEKDITSTIAMHNLGSVLGRLEKYDEAIEWLERCLNARTEVLGPDAPQTLSTAKKLNYLRGKVSDQPFEGGGPQVCNDETQDISSSSSACSENPVIACGDHISDA